MNKKYSMVIAARHLFDSVSDQEAEGYLCIRGPMIVKKENGVPDEDTIRQAEQVLYFDEELVMPGIVATAIYTFINAWNEFLYSLILINSTDKMTVSVALKSLQGAEILNWGDMMAASALVVVPSVVFFMFIQNKIAGGMTQGAVK